MSLHKGLSIGCQPPESFYKDLGVTCFVTRYENLGLKFNPALVQLGERDELVVAGFKVPARISPLELKLQQLCLGTKDLFTDAYQDIRHFLDNNNRDVPSRDPVRRGNREVWVEKVMRDMGMPRHQYKQN